MNQSEDNKYRKQWQDAFRNEEETPPPFIWQALEEKLDAKSPQVKPLVWWKNPRVYYFATAACLLVAFLLGKNLFMDEQSTDIITNKVATNSSIQGAIPTPTTEQSTSIDQQAEIVVEQSTNALLAASDKQVLELSTSDTPASSNKLVAKESEGIHVVAYQEESSEQRAHSKMHGEIESTESGPSANATTLVALAKQEYIEPRARFNKRIIFYRPVIEEEQPEEEESIGKKEYYAAASMMPALFDPKVSVASPNGATTAFQASNSRSRKGDVPSRAGTSIAVQTYGGIKLNKRWSIETGISYLKGNSVFESNGYVMDMMNAHSINSLETALASSSNKVAHKLPQYNSLVVQQEVTKNTPMYYMDVKEGYQNNYSFLQLPLQAGYTLSPYKKLSYTILGGIVGNLFLQNELSLTTGGKLRTSASDNSYQPLRWSASSGLRINYRLGENWSTMLTGSCQKALLETGSTNTGIELKPQLFGIGWGVKVNF